MGSIFKPQDPVDLFFLGFSEGYWEHMNNNIATVINWMGG